MEYLNEHLIPGVLGKIFINVAFFTSIISVIAFYLSVKKSDENYRVLGKYSFIVNAGSVFGAIITLFYIIYNNYFEYNYVWSNSSRSLEIEYIISCFWAGQEGSCLVWIFFQTIIGLFIIQRNSAWLSDIVVVIALSQVFLLSMLLGYNVLDIQIGHSPFALLRESTPSEIFNDPNYLANYVTDGRGLNPLLKNIWMVIHPPILFLGFSSLVIPFAYALTALRKKDTKEWVDKAFPWILFSIMSLGSGILMGAYWAYESLNFGGYWTWDPVENASLIPWIAIIIALHFIIILKNQGRYYTLSLVATTLSFILVLYAAYLTRSGVLGNSSVHSFSESNIYWIWVVYIFTFISITVYHFIKYKITTQVQEEESLLSREFWILLGALVLMLSALQILGFTSVPVINKILSTDIAPPINVIEFYNQWQMPFAILLLVVTGFGPLLKYKKTTKEWITKFIVILIFTLLLSAVAFYFMLSKGLLEINIKPTEPNILFVAMLVSAIWCILSNLLLFINVVKKQVTATGGYLAHFGLGLMLLGALVSSSQKSVVSKNTINIDLGEEYNLTESDDNILLIKDIPVPLSNYLVTYQGDSALSDVVLHKVKYQNDNEEFILYPQSQITENMGLIASPDTRHYFTHDIFTHIVSIASTKSDSLLVKTQKVSIGDIVFLNDMSLKIKDIENAYPSMSNEGNAFDVAVSLIVEVYDNNKKYVGTIKPLYIIKNNSVYTIEDSNQETNISLKFISIVSSENKFEIEIKYPEKNALQYIVLQTIVFPYIILFWIGAIIMLLGVLVALVNRSRK